MLFIFVYSLRWTLKLPKGILYLLSSSTNVLTWYNRYDWQEWSSDHQACIATVATGKITVRIMLLQNTLGEIRWQRHSTTNPFIAQWITYRAEKQCEQNLPVICVAARQTRGCTRLLQNRVFHQILRCTPAKHFLRTTGFKGQTVWPFLV